MGVVAIREVNALTERVAGVNLIKRHAQMGFGEIF